MRKIIYATFITGFLFAACKKENPRQVKVIPPTRTTAAKGFVKVTIDEKTYEARDTFLTPYDENTYCSMLNTFSVKENVFNGAKKDKIFTVNTMCCGRFSNGDVKLIISATAFNKDNTSPIDTFATATESLDAFSLELFKEDPIKKYAIKSGSTITITSFDGTKTEGTMKLNLKNNADGSDKEAKVEFRLFNK